MLLNILSPKNYINSILRYQFSNLKDRLQNIKSHPYKNHKQFYQNIRKFQDNLDYNEWLKFKKLIYEVDRINRRFQTKKREQIQKHQLQAQQSQKDIIYQMDGSITSQYFYEKYTQFIFYKQQIPPHKLQDTKPQIKTLPLHQLKKLVIQSTQKDSLSYFSKIIPLGSQLSSYHKSITRRYEAIQENLCRLIFKGYTEFSQFEENLFFKTEQKYKGDFKFQIKGDSQLKEEDLIYNKDLLLLQFSQIAKNLALMNQCRAKVQLAIQMILNQSWSSINQSTLANLLFCTAINGKELKEINLNFDQISKKLLNSSHKQESFLSLILYMCISKIQNQELYDEINNLLPQSSDKKYSVFEKIIFKAALTYFSQAKQIDLVLNEKLKSQLFNKQNNSIIDNNPENSQSLNEFKKYLQQKNYKFSIISSNDRSNIIAPYHIIEIQNKKFVCYSRLFYQSNQQTNTLNGLAKLVNEYFLLNGEKIKIINGKSLQIMEKWTQKEDYFKSKLKGINKPDVKKEKKFDFHSPREDFFSTKQDKNKNK